MNNITKYAVLVLAVVICFYAFAIGMSTQMAPTQYQMDLVFENMTNLVDSGYVPPLI